MSNFKQVHDTGGWYKGKFTTGKRLKAKKNVKNYLNKRWDVYKEEKREREANANLCGNIATTKRRVVELNQMAEDLWCRKCNQSLSLRDFVEEEQHGLAFNMIVKCKTCNTNWQVQTAKESTKKGTSSM